MKDYKKMFVFTAYIKTNQINIKVPFLVLSNIYNILSRRMHKCGRILEEKSKGYLLKSGPCRVCKKCALKENKPCSSPIERRYGKVFLQALDTQQDTEKMIEAGQPIPGGLLLSIDWLGVE